MGLFVFIVLPLLSLGKTNGVMNYMVQNALAVSVYRPKTPSCLRLKRVSKAKLFWIFMVIQSNAIAIIQPQIH